MDKSSVNYKSIEAFLVIIDKHRLMIGLMDGSSRRIF